MSLIPESNPSSSAPRAVHLLLIGAFLRENRLHDALAWLHRFMVNSPVNAESWILLGFLCAESRLPEQAHAFYNCAVKQSPDYVPIVEELNMDLLAPKATGTPCDIHNFDPVILSERFASLPATERNDISRKAAYLADRLAATAIKLPASDLNNEVKRLLPALVQANLRQALSAGREDLAEGLRDLNISLGRQKYQDS